MNWTRILVCSLLCFTISILGFGQDIQISGTVTASDDIGGVIGATIKVKDEDRGTITDLDGNYSIKVNSTESVLIFSYLGYKPQEVIVGTQKTIDVTLEPDISVIDEVVVVGYGSKKKSNISGAVTTVTAEEISELPILRPEQALQGKTSGISVAQVSGSPGSPLTIRVRGTGTINNSDPLYIVDGVAVDGLDFINPNDIETMNVLKDAASAAIYGARGGNGVVLITTKSGSKDTQGSVTYDAYYGIQQPWKKINLLSAEEYAAVSNKMHIAAGKVPLPEFAVPSALGEGTDWQDAIFENAPITNHYVSFNGGGEKSNFLLSANYFHQDGIVGGDKSGFERYTVRFNASHKVKKWLTVGNTFNYTHLDRNLLPENNEFTTPIVRALNMDPVTPVRKSDGTYAYSVYADTDIANPVNAIEQTYDTWNSNRIVGTAYLDAKIIDGLYFKSTASLDATFAERKIFYPEFNLSNDTTLNEAPPAEKNLDNSVVFENNTWRNWQWENTLRYSVKIKENHAIDALVGTAALYNWHIAYGGANSNLPSNDPEDAFLANTIDPIESQSAFSWAEESALLSYFGKVGYGYKDKYLLEATMRVDGSSRFGSNNRYGIFPSISGAWVLSRENFFDFGPISFLKLKASWGQNGNDRIGNYAYTTIVNSGQNYTFGVDEDITNGNVPLTASNPDLKWETIEQTNIGLEMELFEGRIFVSTDYYIKNTNDMLHSAPVPLVSGAFPPVQNIGSVRNKGWELVAEYKNRVKGFKYSIGGNITTVKNEVIDLGNSDEPIVSGRVQSANANVARTEVGHPIASFYGYVTDGVFQNQAEINDHAFQNEATIPGDIRFKDLNGDGFITDEDQTYIGNPSPDLIYGFTGSIEWKGIDLNIFFQGVHGNDIYNATVRYDFTYVNRPNAVLSSWNGEGTSNEEPALSLSDLNQNARVSDRFVEDGSYLRIKNIQLGYTLPKKVLSKMKMKKLRVYVAAQNLFTFTKYSGLDPEIGSFFNSPLEIGIDKGFYPQPRTYIAGINVTF